MITVEDREVPYREAMSVREAIVEADFIVSTHIVLVNDFVVSDIRSRLVRDGDKIRLLRLAGGG